MQTSDRVALLSVDFNYATQTLYVQCRGHASECLDFARQLGQLMLGSSPWHITAIAGQLPEAYTFPSEMVVDIYMNGERG